MLKFKNIDTRTGKEVIYQISMLSVQGGVEVDVDEIKSENEIKNVRRRTIILTPIDAAEFVHYTRVTNGLSCREVGHGISVDDSGWDLGLTLSVQKIVTGDADDMEFVDGMEFVGDVSDVVLTIAGISMVVPTFVIDAMRLAIERMSEALMFPSTGETGEEFF